MKNYLRIALLAGVSMLSAYTLSAQAYAQVYTGDVGGSQGDVGGSQDDVGGSQCDGGGSQGDVGDSQCDGGDSQDDVDDNGGFHPVKWFFGAIFRILRWL